MKLLTSFAVVTVYYILIQFTTILAYVKFTNLKCVNYDKNFLEIRVCKLKALSRNKVALSTHVHLFDAPINNISLNLDVYKKANGYRPFMFNITMDFCSFLKNKKRIPFAKFLMDVVELYSNVNHSCPYNHDFIFKDMVVKTEQLQSLPVPTGEYLIRLKAGFYNVWRLKMDTYMQVVEE